MNIFWPKMHTKIFFHPSSLNLVFKYILGNLVTTPRNSRYRFVFSDKYLMLVRSILMHSTTAEAVAKA